MLTSHVNVLLLYLKIFIYLGALDPSCSMQALLLNSEGFSGFGFQAPEHLGSVVALSELGCPRAHGKLVP